MKTFLGLSVILTLLAGAGCASSRGAVDKAEVHETGIIPTNYRVLGPISVREEIDQDQASTIQGIAGYLGKQGDVSRQLPDDMEKALRTQKDEFKPMIYDKLAVEAKKQGADAVYDAEYSYLPPGFSFSKKAVVIAEGQMAAKSKS